MNLKIFAIKDNLVGFNNIFTAPNMHVALRMFADTCRDDKSLLAQHPEDYEIYELGELDQDTGQIKSEVKHLDKALNFVKIKQ